MEDMRGQGERKKIKVDPSLADGGEREENDGDGGGAGDNIPGVVQNPFLNHLVMRVLFKQFSLLNHDDSPEGALIRFAGLRLVCKVWNDEIGKIIRKQTRIDVSKIISAYPKGLGWAPTTTEDPDNPGYKYSAPMPEAIGTFQNLSVTIRTCDALTNPLNPSIVKWFQVMGSSVKSLDLWCSLTCPHQNRFVERILKEWCPNLESLTLQGVQCIESLIQNSYFAAPSLENQCRSLKEFILLYDGLQWSRRWSNSCGLTIEDLEGPRNQQFQDIAVRKEIDEDRYEFVSHLVNYVDRAGEAATSLVQEQALLNKLVRVRRPIGLTSLEGMTPRTIGTHVAAFFQGKFSCDAGHETDGGIFGQLLKMSKVEKLVIRRMMVEHTWVFNELFAKFFYRPNLWNSSLQHFECFGQCPEVADAYLRHYIPPKNIFSKVGFPLKRLKLIRGCFPSYHRLDPQSMERILSGCAETLEELELGLGNCVCHRQITLPVLPKLKVLVVECNGERKVKVTSQDILRKLPKLERCVVTVEGNEGSSATSFFGGNGGDEYWDGGRSHPLKELKMLDEYVDERNIEWMVMWFPNLKMVYLSIGPECGEAFRAFWENMGELPLEQVKMSLSVESGSVKAYDLFQNAIGDNIEVFKDLQWLELVNEGLHPFPLTIKLSKGFAKATKLRLLKFTNFEVDGNVAEEIKKNLPDAVVQLPAIRSSALHEKKTLMNLIN